MTNNLTRLRRVRTAVRLTLILGVAASVAANILHANPNPISQAIAAWAPLALLLCVELISRVPVHRPGHARIRMAATTIIAGIAAWVSYWHMVGVAQRYGETGATPYLLPISVDGLIIVASISLVETGNRIRQLETTHHDQPPTNIAGTGTGITPAQPANPPANRPAAVAIPVETAARLAATFPPPAPNGTRRLVGDLVQEPLL